jgi:hypothetical protein
MAERAISEAWFHRIKAATRDLVKACGGIERAAEIAFAGKSTVGRWQHAGEEDIIPLPAALALEADCDRPFVTRVMADLNGRGLTDPEASSAAAGCLLSGHNALMGEFAALTTEVAAATADGHVSPAEAEMADRAAAALERKLADFRATCAAKKSGPTSAAGDVTRLRPRGA